MIETEIKEAVREHYARAAAGDCCGGGCGCDKDAGTAAVEFLGVPSFGCGTPVEAAELRSGEIVLDLGSGRGLDAFRAAQRVGAQGRVIGVDMTPAMVALAREDAARFGLSQIEFRLGEIEHLPVAGASVDVVLSNCVLNLIPDKGRAFAEAFRVLRAGGRMVVSDMVRAEPRADGPIDPERWAACIDGAEPEWLYLQHIHCAGFADVKVLARGAGGVYSLTVASRKP